MTDTLHVFHNDDSEWFVARDVDDAWKVAIELWGGTREEWEADSVVLERCPDDSVIRINEAEEDAPPACRSLTCAEWAKSNGRGFLCATDY